jgi:hypothetical protein
MVNLRKLDDSHDTLYKVRPLLNVLKHSVGMYLIPGNDLAVDESSVACQSKYLRELIFFNSSKPTCKYHFHSFNLHDSSTYACLRIRFHTRNRCDEADGLTLPPANMGDENLVEGSDLDAEEDEINKTTQIVMDLAKNSLKLVAQSTWTTTTVVQNVHWHLDKRGCIFVEHCEQTAECF